MDFAVNSGWFLLDGTHVMISTRKNSIARLIRESFSAIARSVMISTRSWFWLVKPFIRGFSAIARSVMISTYSVPGLVDHF